MSLAPEPGGEPAPALQDDIAGVLGWRPAAWRRVGGGYTPAARYVARSGERAAFVKIATNDVTVAHMRREIATYGRLSGPFMPRCLGWRDDGDAPFLVLEDLSGAAWPPPWSPDSVRAVRDRIVELHARRDALPTYAEVHGEREPGWPGVAADPAPFLSLGLASEAWLARSLPSLIQAEADCRTAGEAVTHWDLRSDNICLRDGAPVFIDWGEACLANPALDLGGWLPSLAFEGGPEPDDILPAAPEVAAWVCGYFAARAGLPTIALAPFVRRVQREQLSTALPWVCRALGLAPPDQQK